MQNWKELCYKIYNKSLKSQKRLFEINRYIGKRREKHCKIFNFHFIYIYTSQILFLSLRESTIRIKVRQVELQYFQNCTDIFNNNPLSPPEEIFSYYYDPLTYLTESQRFSSSSVVSGGGKENQSYIVFSLLYCIEIGVCSKSSTTRSVYNNICRVVFVHEHWIHVVSRL